MFGDESCGKDGPWSEMASVDGSDKGIFDGAEECHVELFG